MRDPSICAVLLSAAFFSTAFVSEIAPTTAQTLSDSEPNDTQANIGQLSPGQPLIISGQLSSQDNNDLYALTVNGNVKSITIDTHAAAE